jgi:hypothetical protein
MFRVLIGRTRGRVRSRWSVLVSFISVAWVGFPVAAARADSVVNYTFHVPASVQTNPCFPADVINLNGDIHVVITTTTASSGGYHVTDHLNSQLSGASITTGTDYVNSEDQYDGWYAGSPFPAIHTHTYDFDLISKSGTANYILHTTMHETVTANGTPAATIDNWQMDCSG